MRSGRFLTIFTSGNRVNGLKGVRVRTMFDRGERCDSLSLFQPTDRPKNLTEPLYHLCAWITAASKSVNVSAGAIVERILFRGLEAPPSARSNVGVKHDCLPESVESQGETWWAAANGVCPVTAGVAGLSVVRVSRQSSGTFH